MIPHSVKQGNKKCIVVGGWRWGRKGLGQNLKKWGGIGNIGSGLHKIGGLGPFANYVDQKTFLAFSF